MALPRLVRFSRDAERRRQLPGAAPFLLTQVLSAPLCMMQAATGFLPNSRLEKRVKGRWTPGTACVAGRGASGATSPVRRAEPRDAAPTTQGRVTAPLHRSLHHAGAWRFPGPSNPRLQLEGRAA